MKLRLVSFWVILHSNSLFLLSKNGSDSWKETEELTAFIQYKFFAFTTTHSIKDLQFGEVFRLKEKGNANLIDQDMMTHLKMLVLSWPIQIIQAINYQSKNQLNKPPSLSITSPNIISPQSS